MAASKVFCWSEGRGWWQLWWVVHSFSSDQLRPRVNGLLIEAYLKAGEKVDRLVSTHL